MNCYGIKLTSLPLDNGKKARCELYSVAVLKG